MTNPTIRYWGDLNTFTGWHNAARGYLEVLRGLGYGPEHVRLLGTCAENAKHAQDDPFLAPYLAFTEAKARHQLNIVHAHLYEAGRYHTRVDRCLNVLITVWESDRMPQQPAPTAYGDKSPAEVCNLFDEVWVAREATRALMQAAGVTTTIRVIPHAIHDAELVPVARETSGRFAFYGVGTWDRRKDWPTALRAYTQVAHPLQTDFSLHAPAAPGAAQGPHSLLVAQEVKLLRQAANGIPNLGVFSSRHDRSWLRGLHQLSDVLVCTSRAEGFCLPVLEALQAGNLAIVGEHVAEPFRGLPGLVVVPSRKVPVEVLPQYRGYELDHEWWEVDINALVEAMRAALAAGVPPLEQRAARAAAVRARFDALVVGQAHEVDAAMRGLAATVKARHEMW